MTRTQYGWNDGGQTSARTAMQSRLRRLMVLVVGLVAMQFHKVVQAGPCTPTVSIGTQPNSQSACQGETATFDVNANSTVGGLTLQWQFSTNGGASFQNVIAGTGGNTSSYTTATLASSDNGTQFRVVADDATGCPLISNAVGLTVNPLPIATPFVTASSSTICAGQSTNINILGPQIGVNYQLRNSLGNVNVGNPVPGGGGAISLPTGPLNVTTNLNVLATVVATGCSQQLNGTQTITVNPLPDASLAVGATSDAICDGTSTEVTVSSSEPGVTYRLRNNSGNAAIGFPVAGTGGTILFPTGSLNATTTFNVLATVNSSNCSQQLAEIQTITIVSPPDPGLPVGATSSFVCPGNASSVTVVDSAVGVTYQLRDDSDNSHVGGAVAGTGGTIELSTGILTVTKTFNILATVTGSTCSQPLSATQTITVTNLPDASLPVGATLETVCPGAGSTITVGGSSVGVSYQLRNNANNALVGNAVAGTGGTINLPTGPLTVQTSFNVLATTDSTGCVAQLSDTQTINVRADTEIQSHPISKTVCEGSVAEFVVAAEGADLSYQWQVSLDGGVNYQDVAVDGTSNVYKTPATKSIDSGSLFRVAIKDPCETQFSLAAALTVHIAPTISKHPENGSAMEGSAASLVVVANGTGPLKYIWQVSKDGGKTFDNIVSGAGADTASYTTAALSFNENGFLYRVRVFNDCGDVTSNAASIEVVGQSPPAQPNPFCGLCGIGCYFGVIAAIAGLVALRQTTQMKRFL